MNLPLNRVSTEMALRGKILALVCFELSPCQLLLAYFENIAHIIRKRERKNTENFSTFLDINNLQVDQRNVHVLQIGYVRNDHFLPVLQCS